VRARTTTAGRKFDLHGEAAKYGRFVFLCGYFIAEETARPTWNKGDFFGEHYGKKKD
jgi:hypothetical protein